MNKISIITICCATLMLSSASASAAIVDLDRVESGNTFGTPNWSGQVDRTLNGDLTEGLSGGLFRLTDGVENILAFCIQPGIGLNLEMDFDTMIPATTAAQYENLDKLFTSAYTQVVDSQSALAFQLAIWEVMAEDPLTTFDLGSGNLKAENETVAGSISLGMDFLNGLASASTGAYELTTYVNSGQNLISASPVPLPAPALLLFGGLGGLAGLRRWKKPA